MRLNFKNLNKKFKIYIITSIVFILVFLVGINILRGGFEEFLLWRITYNQDTFTASVAGSALKPIRNWEVEDIKVNGESVLCVEIDSSGNKKILFKKDEDKQLPIASLAKLMTALVSLEIYNPSRKVVISSAAVSQEGEHGQLKVGDTLSVENLIYIILMESSNDAAYALSQILGVKPFVTLMNLRAEDIGLNNTHFVNSTGLDPINSGDSINYSTAEDLIKLTDYLLGNERSIWEILSLQEFYLYGEDGTLHHKLSSTNKLLGEIPDIIGGKTGWTPKAKECFLVVSENPRKRGFLIYVILGTENKFEEMKKLIDWTQKAFSW